MKRQTTPGRRIPFAGLTSHNNAAMSDRAASIAGMDSDDPPETSFATAIRELETAQDSELAWKVPEDVADHLSVDDLNEATPDGTRVFTSPDNTVWVQTDRFQSVISPDKIQQYVNDEYTDEDGDWVDALWHVPTKDYSIVNPLTAYQPLEEAVRDEDLGDSMFGEIREYKGGGEVHMDILFDAYQIDYNADSGGDPIVLGVRSGYDFFGGTALYYEGYAQDTRCSNSIRSVTDEKSIRHVGDVDLEDEVSEILEELGVMTNRLAELIELAEDIEVPLLDLDLADTFDAHDDNMRAFYELAGFPSYLATEAANHATTRAENRFSPDMTAVWDGATYALTHHYRGGENTSRAQELIDTANDFIYNPSASIGRIRRQHERRVASGSDNSEQVDLEGESASAKITEFEESVQDKANEFESRNEELRNTLVEEAEAEAPAA